MGGNKKISSSLEVTIPFNYLFNEIYKAILDECKNDSLLAFHHRTYNLFEKIEILFGAILIRLAVRKALSSEFKLVLIFFQRTCFLYFGIYPFLG